MCVTVLVLLFRRFIRKQDLLFKNSTVFIISRFPIVKVSIFKLTNLYNCPFSSLKTLRNPERRLKSFSMFLSFYLIQ